MFKLGDRGRTRGGNHYVITSINDKHHHAGGIQRIRASINDEDRYHYCDDGQFSLYELSPDDLDLMPPDSHDYSTESESVPAKDEYSVTDVSELEQMAILAEKYGVTIELRIGDIAYLVSRTSSLT